MIFHYLVEQLFKSYIKMNQYTVNEPFHTVVKFFA